MVYTPASKAWGSTGTTLSVCLSACLKTHSCPYMKFETLNEII